MGNVALLCQSVGNAALSALGELLCLSMLNTALFFQSALCFYFVSLWGTQLLAELFCPCGTQRSFVILWGTLLCQSVGNTWISEECCC